MYWWAAIRGWYISDTLYHSLPPMWQTVCHLVKSDTVYQYVSLVYFEFDLSTCSVAWKIHVSWRITSMYQEYDTYHKLIHFAIQEEVPIHVSCVYYTCLLVTHVSQPSQSAWCWKYTENTDVIVSNTHKIHMYCHEYHKKNRIQFKIHVIHHKYTCDTYLRHSVLCRSFWYVFKYS